MMKRQSLAIITLVVLLFGGLVLLSSCKTQKTESSGVFPQGTAGTKVDTGETKEITGTVTVPPRETKPATAKPAVQADTTPLTRPNPSETTKKMPPPTQADMDAARKASTQHATIKTAKGTIEVALYGADTPLTVANFVKLATAKFYDGLTFHRVEPGFVIQGGDPNGDGSGGPGYMIRREVSKKLKHDKGVLAMARTSDPDSAGSQFYITLANTYELDSPPNGPYTVFGRVLKGMDVVEKIKKGDKILSVRIH